MKRQTFLSIAAFISVLFGAVILAGPDKMMEGMGTQSTAATNVVLQVVSIFLICIGLITFLARKDEGSIALRAIIIGSIVMHVVLLPIDWIAYQRGTFPQMSGFLPGSIVHIIFAVGFIYYLSKLPKTESPT